MKIDSTSLKPFTTDIVPVEFTEFIEKLKNADSVNEFVQLLDKANEWCNVFGKTEMGRWVDVLNRCDSILETAITKHKETGSLAIDTDDSLERPLISVLRFTWLLFENSFTRSVYSSMDRLLHLLDCTKMSIVVQALRLLLIISKSSRYISQHMSHDDQQMLSMKLTAITECWNGKHLRNLEMKDCCGPETPKEDVFHLTYRTHSGTKDFHVDHKWPIEKARMELQNVLISSGNEVDESEKILLMTRLRLAYSFNDYHARMYSAMARLISISVLFYSRCLLDEQTINILADDKLIEQICALVYLNTTADSPLLDTVKTEALKTLASIVFLEKPRKIQLVVDNLGLNSYHGFTTTLMRRCVETLKAGLVESQGDFSVNFVTALFSLLYHVCGYDYGSDSLISCSMVEILLGVVQTYTLPESQISFVTRSVRIIDILTGIDAADFNSHDGMNVIVNRFIYEVDMCKQQLDDPQNPNRTTICHQQRTALMKSLLNFLKRSVVDTNFAAQIRRIMEGNLPAALIHIIQNPLFYGSSLLHSAIQLTTSFIYQEPAQLTLLQDKNLTEALTKSIFKDDFPISRDIIMSLPNICSALCLNERGLKSFNEQNPLQRIFRIIFSTKFLSSIRKRKNEIFDTATTLGAAFDELMRHQPTLRKEVVSAFCQVLDEIIKLANSEPYKCVISSNQSKWTSEIEEPSGRPVGNRGGDGVPADISAEYSQSISDDDTEDIDTATSSTSRKDSMSGSLKMHFLHQGIKVLPLGDYLTITGKLLEAILTNSGSNENGQAVLDGEMPDRLVRFLTLKKPPFDILHSNFLSTVASILRYILQQTNKVQPIGVLLSNLTTQLEEFSRESSSKRYSTASEFIEDHSKPEMTHLLVRLGCLIQVMTNFIKNAQSNQWESRSVMLTFLTTIDSGKQFIHAMFDCYRTMNWQLGLINAAIPPVEAQPKSDDKSESSKIAETSSADSKTETSISTPAENKETPQVSSASKNISQMLGRSHKHLAEIINLIAKVFFGGLQRARRGIDQTYMKHANFLAESLFAGLNELLKWDSSFPEESFHYYMGNSLTLVRKLLFFDDHRSPHFMLPFFYKSICHHSFFKLSDVFLAKGINDDANTSLISWLCIVQRLISVDSVLYVRNKNDRVLCETFDVKKYFAVCQNDAMKSLTKLFDVAMLGDSTDGSAACKLVDRVICVLQELVHAMVQLNQTEKAKETSPTMDTLLHEVDEDKVRTLVEMGFLRTDATEALLQFTTVPEAAEYLLTFNTATTSIAEPRQETPAQETPTQVTPTEVTPTEVTPVEVENKMEVEETPSTSKAPEPTEEPTPNLSEADTIDFKGSIKYICDEIIPRCLALLEKDTKLVFGIAELLTVFINEPVATEWVQNVLIKQLLIADLSNVIDEVSQSMENEKVATRFASTLHLLCLLWQKFDTAYLEAVLNSNFYNMLTRVFFTSMDKGKANAPFLPPLLLWLDLFEKEKRLYERRKLFTDSVENIQWIYWVSDERYGSNSGWRDFPPIASAALSQAFKDGKTSSRITINDKPVLVDFVDMTQRYLESSAQTAPIYGKAKLVDGFDIQTVFDAEKRLSLDLPQHKLLIKNAIKMLQSRPNDAPLHMDHIFSALSLLLNLITGNVDAFVEADGIPALFSLECSNQWPPAMTKLIVLILRCCLDDETTLTHAYEKILRQFASGAPVSVVDANLRMLSTKSRRYQKDWKRALHQLMPLCNKNASTFISVMQQMAKHKNNEVVVSPTKSDTDTHEHMMTTNGNDSVLKMILSQAFNELMSIDQAHQEKRVMRDGVLLQFIAELLRSYRNAAHFLVELKHEKRSFVACLLEDFLGRKNANDITIAVRAVIVNLASSNSAKAHDLLVTEIRSTLHGALANTKQPQELCDKVVQLARLVLLIRDSTQTHALQRSRESIKHQHSVLRLMYKKNLVIDFAKAIWYLPLQDKMASDALNTILRMFEELARVFSQINAPTPTSTNQATQAQQGVQNPPQEAAAAAREGGSNEPVGGDVGAPINQQELEGRVASALATLNAHVDHLRNAAGIENDVHPAREDQFDDEDEDAGDNLAARVFVHHDRIDDMEQDDEEDDDDDEDDYDDLSNSGGSNAEHDEESSSEDDHADDSRMPDTTHEASALDIDAVFPDAAMEDDRSSSSSDQPEMEQDDHMPPRIEVQLQRIEDVGDEIIRDIDEDEDDEEDEEREDDTEADDAEDEDEIENIFDADYMEHEMRPNDPYPGLRPARVAAIRDGAAFIPPPDSFFDDFEMLAASASYFADFLADGRRHFMAGGIPRDFGLALRSSGAIGAIPSESDPIVSQHPLLSRPPLTINPPPVAERQSTENDNLASMHNYALRTILIGDHDTVTIADREMHHGRHRYPFHRLLAGRRVQGLRRQGALRRWHHAGGANRDDYPRELLGHLLEGNSGRYDFEINSDRRIVDAFIPFFLDRLTDQANLLDPLSMHYLAIVVFAYLTKTLEVIEEKPERKQERAETSTTNQANISVAEQATASASVTTSASTENPATSEETSDSNIQEAIEEPNPEDTEMHSIESIDSADLSSRFAGVVAGGDEDTSADERSRTPVAETTVEATQESSEANTTQQDNESTVTTANLSAMEIDDQPAMNQNAEEVNTVQPEAAQAEPGPSNVPNEYREILGDIEIPEGLDPEFLAALPDDIREEVIRDHLRQQRIQQANRQRTQSINQPAEPVAENAEANNAMETEGIDQEFMAALPPELQEEVLAQHEQRLAQQRQEQAAAENANINQGNPPAPDVDIAALFESLPPGLRAQVLADADDSVVQALPQNLADEARRLRSNWEQQQLFRIARMFDRPQGIRAVPQGGAAMGTAGLMPPFPETPSAGNGIQIFDQESIVTLFLLFFMEQERFNLVRFQKLLKIICTHPGTCDFAIWCLLSMLKVLTEETHEEDMSTPNNGWIDHFQVKTALSQSEKALRVKDKVVVHNLVKQTICSRVLETLIFIARNFPPHFLPQAIRFADKVPEKTSHVPELDHFWATVKKINKQPHEGVKPKPAAKNLHPLREIVPQTFDQAPISILLENSSSKLLKTNSALFDKMLRLLYTISQALPDDAIKKRNLPADQVSSFTNKMSTLIRLILDGACVEEGLKDGRNFIIQVMRSMAEQRPALFEILYDSIKQLGLQLHQQIESLLEELKREKESTKTTETPTDHLQEKEASQKPSSSSSSAHEVTLPPALKAFTARNNQPKKLLKSLESISYIRNQLQVLEKRRKPPAPPVQEKEGEKPSEEPIEKDKTEEVEEACLQSMLETLNPLWNSLSMCLEEVSQFDSRAVLTLQNAAEAFFLAHAFTIQAESLSALSALSASGAAVTADTPSTSATAATSKDGKVQLTKHTQRLLEFAEKHRTVLNQILRGNTNNLMEENAFSILTYFPKLLDFDVKRKYFYKEIRKLEDRIRFRHEDVAVRIRRSHLFYDSFRELIRLKSADWKARFYIIFEGEEGQDAGGLLREWYSVITREIFNENYALFQKAPGDRVTYMINKASYINIEHLDYFKFVGRIIAKAIYDNKQLDCYFTRAFYKHILNINVRYQDIESEDPDYFKSLQFLLENPVETLGTDLNFAVEVEEFGVRSLRQLKEDGSQIVVTDENKEEYVKLVCQMKMTESIRKQIDAFLEGFYDIIPKKLISIFNEQELELLISGLPEIDIDDLCNNTDYKTYTRSSPQIQWFWRALRSFEQEDLAKFLQFVTGTSKVPLQGFSQLEGMNGAQKFTIHMDHRSTDRLPSAHTCFNQLDLPQYESYEKLRQMLLLAIRECSEGFAFA